jgi:hypothetical protein
LIAYLTAFLYFFHMTGQVWAGALMAAPVSALIMLAFRRWSRRRAERRERARRAKSAVEQLVFLPEDEAREQVARYAAFSGRLLQRHPKGDPLGVDELMGLWRDAKGETLGIAITGPVSDAVWPVAESLTAPKVKILDANALSERFAKSGLPLPEPPVKKRRISLRVPRKRAKHCAIYGCAMLGVYIFTGLWAYLAASIILLALMSLALRRPAPSPG